MTADDEPGRYFPFRYESRLAPIWLPFRLWPGTQGVTVTEDGRLIARYGPLRVDAPLSPNPHQRGHVLERHLNGFVGNVKSGGLGRAVRADHDQAHFLREADDRDLPATAGQKQQARAAEAVLPAGIELGGRGLVGQGALLDAASLSGLSFKTYRPLEAIANRLAAAIDSN